MLYVEAIFKMLLCCFFRIFKTQDYNDYNFNYAYKNEKKNIKNIWQKMKNTQDKKYKTKQVKEL